MPQSSVAAGHRLAKKLGVIMSSAKDSVRLHIDRSDVTRLVGLTVEELARELMQQQKLAMTGTLAACIGHELNNQLMVSYGNLEVAQQCMKEQQWNSALERIRCAATVLHDAFSLSQSLFSGVRPEQPPTTLHLNLVIADFLFVLRPYLRKQKASVSFTAAERVPPISAVETDLRQVLFNLIRNAIQSRPEVCINIETRLNSKNDMVTCRIQDNGPGMDRSALQELFSLYHSGRDNGHGLGLFICKEIINRHHGSLTVQSRPGEGTCFTINLPALVR